MAADKTNLSSPPGLLERPKPELQALTGLRFFAAIYVVFYHFVFPNLHSFQLLQGFLSVGYTAVGFFFLLSGFVLSYSYAGRNRQIDRVSFWKARLGRIYPAYLFAFVLAAPFQVIGSIHVNGWRVGLEKLTLGAGLVLALLQAWTPWTAWYWNIPAWSLSVEIFFYLCFPFLVLRVARLSSRACLQWAAACWLVGLLAPAAYCLLRPIAAQPPFAMAQLAIETNPVLRMPEFIAGMLLGRVFLAGYRFPPRWAFRFSLLALAGLIALLTFGSGLPRPLLSNSILIPLSALLIYSLSQQVGWLAHVLSWKAFRILGEASYSIYILQFPVSYIYRLNNESFTVTRFCFYLVGLIALSVVTFFYIEQPLRRRLRGKSSSGTAGAVIYGFPPPSGQQAGAGA